MVPAPVVRALGLGVDVVVVRGEGGRFFLEYRRGMRGDIWASAPIDDLGSPQLPVDLDRLLNGVPLDRVRVEMELDAGAAFARSLRIPRAAENELAGVLSFEIERHTPYRAGEVLFVHRIDDADSDVDTLAVDLTIVPRKTVDDLVERLRAHGLVPEVIRVAAPDGAGGMLTLVGADADGTPRPAGRPIRALAATAAVLAIVAVASPLLRLNVVAQDLETAIAATRERASATLALREEVSTIQETARRITEAKANSPSAVRILDTLSKLLPDGTWLRQVSLVGDEIIVEGYTGSSAGLVSVLESSPLFSSVSYVAPVTRERGGTVESFSFSMKLEGATK